MADTPVWTDEIRFICQPPQGTGDLHCYILIRTDDHFGCPHQVLGWKFKNFGPKSIHDVLNECADSEKVWAWENKMPPDNQYGIEIMAALAKNEELMQATLEQLGSWHSPGNPDHEDVN